LVLVAKLRLDPLALLGPRIGAVPTSIVGSAYWAKAGAVTQPASAQNGTEDLFCRDGGCIPALRVSASLWSAVEAGRAGQLRTAKSRSIIRDFFSKSRNVSAAVVLKTEPRGAVRLGPGDSIAPSGSLELD